MYFEHMLDIFLEVLCWFFFKKFNGVFFIILVIFLAVGVFSRYIYFRDYERLFLDIQTDTKIFQITSILTR